MKSSSSIAKEFQKLEAKRLDNSKSVKWKGDKENRKK